MILNEIDVTGHGNKTYCKGNKNFDEIIDENTQYKMKKRITENEKKALPIMYWIPKMYKNPKGLCFIIATTMCSTKLISNTVSSAFKFVWESKLKIS